MVVATVFDLGWSLPLSNSLHGVVLPQTAMVASSFERLYVLLVFFLSGLLLLGPFVNFRLSGDRFRVK